MGSRAPMSFLAPRSLPRMKKRTGLGPRAPHLEAAKNAGFRDLCQEIWIQETRARSISKRKTGERPRFPTQYLISEPAGNRTQATIRNAFNLDYPPGAVGNGTIIPITLIPVIVLAAAKRRKDRNVPFFRTTPSAWLPALPLAGVWNLGWSRPPALLLHGCESPARTL